MASCVPGRIRISSCIPAQKARGQTITSWTRTLFSPRRGGTGRLLGGRAAALEMIRAGADVNEAQPDGTRPIHWAVYRFDYDLMDALIAKKAKVDVTNEFGSTPLAEATKQGDARMVKTLLAAGSGTEGA